MRVSILPSRFFWPILATIMVVLTGIAPTTPINAAAGMPSAIFDPNSTGWFAVRNMTAADHQDFFESKAAQGYLMIDADRIEIDGNLRVSSVWQRNSDDRQWVSRSNLTSVEFGTYWEQYQSAGMRLIDQDAYLLNGQLRYAMIFVENTEQLDWASLRNQSSTQFSDSFAEYSRNGFIPIDVESYSGGAEQFYSAIWVKNGENLDWALRRDMTSTQFSDYFAQYYEAGMRLHDIEAYTLDGQTRYAGIWVANPSGRAWYAYRDMTAKEYGNRWLELRDAGYRLTDFEVYETSNGMRYAGIWRQNSARPDWEAKNDIDRLVSQYVSANNLAGLSVSIAVEGKIVYLRGFGHANIAQDRPFHSGTIARVASGCKAIAGVLSMELEETTPFDIDTATRTYVPSLPAFHTHTVAQLLSNRAGVRHYQGNNDPTSSTNTQYATALAASALFANDPLLFTPGSDYGYSTHGYTLLGAAIEQEMGKPIGTVLNERLSTPYSLPTLQAENRSIAKANRATLYRGTNSGPQTVVPDNISWKVLGGGCEISGYDYVRLGDKLVQGDILSPASLQRLWTRPNSQANYALGWDTGTDQGNRVVAKTGEQTGARSYIRIYPEKEIVIAILSNQRGHDTAQLGRDIGTLLLNAGIGASLIVEAELSQQALPAQVIEEIAEPQEELGDPFLGIPVTVIIAPTATDDPTEPAIDAFTEGAPFYELYLPMLMR